MEVGISHKLVAVAFAMVAASAFIGFAFLGHLHTPEGQIIHRITITGIVIGLGIVPASIAVQVVHHAAQAMRRRSRIGRP